MNTPQTDRTPDLYEIRDNAANCLKMVMATRDKLEQMFCELTGSTGSPELIQKEAVDPNDAPLLDGLGWIGSRTTSEIHRLDEMIGRLQDRLGVCRARAPEIIQKHDPAKADARWKK